MTKKVKQATDEIIHISLTSGSYWSEAVKVYNSSMDYQTMREANTAAMSILKQEHPEVILETRTQEQMKADENFIKSQKISAPTFDITALFE